jgi:hypothetical protein
VALPTPLVLLSIACVAMAAVVYALTGSSHPLPLANPAAHETPSATPSPSISPSPSPVTRHQHRAPALRRHTVVEVYNNSGISGLAGRTATRASNAGWHVVGSDNWYGTIPASTVYFPRRLADAARLLARDLGIHRLRTAVAPMRFDRLTVILTRGYR